MDIALFNLVIDDVDKAHHGANRVPVALVECKGSWDQFSVFEQSYDHATGQIFHNLAVIEDNPRMNQRQPYWGIIAIGTYFEFMDNSRGNGLGMPNGLLDLREDLHKQLLHSAMRSIRERYLLWLQAPGS